MNWRFGMILSTGLASALLGCGAGNNPGSKPPEGAKVASSVERFLPLKPNTVWSYETYSENTGERGLLMMEAQRPRENLVELSIGGKVQRLELTADGIMHATGGYLLKGPLSNGARWKGQTGDVSVSAMDKSVSVPAGTFQGCVETVEHARLQDSEKKITTVFCPDVGITVLEVQGIVNGEYGLERASLKSFGPKVDISDF